MRTRLRAATLSLVSICCACEMAGAQSAPVPLALVKVAVENEVLDAQDRNTLFRYTLQKETASGNSVREMVETKDGIVARTVLWNGRQLTAEERETEDRRLRRLLESPSEQRKKFKEQREDQERVMRILKALPDALLYKHDGTEIINGRQTIRLRFTPNPDYSPSARELYLFKSAHGQLWIDSAEQRIVRLSGTLMKEVGIGWGLLGHLDKGGTFRLEQQAVAPQRWRLTRLNLDVKGKALFFKTVRVKQQQQGYNFRPITQMSVAEAIELLRQG